MERESDGMSVRMTKHSDITSNTHKVLSAQRHIPSQIIMVIIRLSEIWKVATTGTGFPCKSSFTLQQQQTHRFCHKDQVICTSMNTQTTWKILCKTMDQDWQQWGLANCRLAILPHCDIKRLLDRGSLFLDLLETNQQPTIMFLVSKLLRVVTFSGEARGQAIPTIYARKQTTSLYTRWGLFYSTEFRAQKSSSCTKEITSFTWPSWKNVTVRGINLRHIHRLPWSLTSVKEPQVSHRYVLLTFRQRLMTLAFFSD